MRQPKLVGLALALTMAVAGLAPASGALAQRPRTRRSERVLRLPGFELVGDLRRPRVYYVLERAGGGDTVLELRRSFVPDLVRTVDHRPF